MNHRNSGDFTKNGKKKLSIHEGISNFPPNKVKIWLQKSNENGPDGAGGEGSEISSISK